MSNEATTAETAFDAAEDVCRCKIVQNYGAAVLQADRRFRSALTREANRTRPGVYSDARLVANAALNLYRSARSAYRMALDAGAIR